MALRIANNVSALNAQRNLNKSQNMLQSSLERLSSGLRINKAADDAAGLSISQSFRADIASFKQASKNASQAVAVLQTAEGGMDQIHNMLTRLKELATQAASDNVEGNRTDINSEATQLISEIDRIANSTEYSGVSLLDGYGAKGSTSSLGYGDVYDVDVSNASKGTIAAASISYNATANELTLASGGVSETQSIAADSTVTFSQFDISFKTTAAASADAIGASVAGNNIVITTSGTGGTFQLGAKDDTNNQLSFTIDGVTKSDLSLTSVALTSRTGAQSAMTTIDTAIDTVSTARAKIGANQNRLSYASANLATSIENATAAESVIRDADVANEMTQFTKSQILQQAGTAMLAQANALPQAALSLLG